MAPKKGTKKVVEKLNLASLMNCPAPGYLFTFPDEHAELVEAGYVQVNADLKDENGAIATAITPAGIKFVESQNETKTEGTTSMPTNDFMIVLNVEFPTKKRGGRKETTYPFDKLEPGQSFFIPVTEKRPDPAKSLASTVSTANQRYAEPDPSGKTRTVTRGERKGEQIPAKIFTRKFEIAAFEDGTPWGFPGQAGAAIRRVK